MLGLRMQQAMPHKHANRSPFTRCSGRARFICVALSVIICVDAICVREYGLVDASRLKGGLGARQCPLGFAKSFLDVCRLQSIQAANSGSECGGFAWWDDDPDAKGRDCFG